MEETMETMEMQEPADATVNPEASEQAPEQAPEETGFRLPRSQGEFAVALERATRDVLAARLAHRRAVDASYNHTLNDGDELQAATARVMATGVPASKITGKLVRTNDAAYREFCDTTARLARERDDAEVAARNAETIHATLLAVAPSYREAVR